MLVLLPAFINCLAIGTLGLWFLASLVACVVSISSGTFHIVISGSRSKRGIWTALLPIVFTVANLVLANYLRTHMSLLWHADLGWLFGLAVTLVSVTALWLGYRICRLMFRKSAKAGPQTRDLGEAPNR